MLAGFRRESRSASEIGLIFKGGEVENMTRILLYSDEPILAKGLESILRQVEGFELLPTCGSVPALLAQTASGQALDILLLDLTPEITFGVLSDLKRTMQTTRVVLWV